MKKNILVKPIITEKTLNLAHTENQYTFQVNSAANKIEIGKAVALKFGVEVSNISVMRVLGKKTAFGRTRIPGQKKSYKKAVVRLKQGDSISDFDIK